MMKYCIIFFIICALGCTKSRQKVTDVIKDFSFSTKSITADGTTIINISATLNPDADADKRNVLFTASSGSFLNGKDSTISQKATFVNEKLIAQVSFKAPSTPGTIQFSAKPDIPSYYDIGLTDSIIAVASVASKIKIRSSSFSVFYGFVSEDTVTATLSNAKGAGVSQGTKVIIYDSLANGNTMQGRFRSVVASTNSNSQVSAIYSPGFIVPPGTDIYLIANVLDANGVRLPIRDMVTVTVIQ